MDERVIATAPAGAVRAAVSAVVRPSAAADSLPLLQSLLVMTIGLAITVGCLLLPSMLRPAAIPPAYLKATATRLSLPVEDPAVAKAADERLKAGQYRFARAAIQASLRSIVIVTAFWWGVGLLLVRAPVRSLGRVFSAVAVAAIVPSIGLLARVLIEWISGHDPDRFTLAGFAGLFGVSAQWPERIDIIEVWWACVLALGLAKAWKRPTAAVVILVVLPTFLWLLFSHALHSWGW
jgi:hypothetical protein